MWPPYLGEHGPEGYTLRRRDISCEGVGTVYLIPSEVYTTPRGASAGDGSAGAGLGPPEHFPTAFTEHFPVIHAAKYGLGMSVTTALDVVVQHANLPAFGLQWHKEPMSIWSDWLEPFVGRLFEDAEVKVTKPPAFWCDGEGDDGVALPETAWAARAEGAQAEAVRQITRRPSCHLLGG